jgi:hypothetical protein
MAAISGKGDTFELDLLKIIFNATAIANIADNAASSPLTNLYVALHTADPLEAGDQTSNEATFTNYARVAVARTSGGWTCATASGVSTASNAAAITFPACGVTGNTITHVSIGVATSGASKMLYGGALTASLAISNGITASFAIGQLSVSED